ncbi:MAG: mannose-1-phosphate guanylyltransferase/mannose-6-phosphate isomerase, partial [Candidatus Cloacimonadia bacterium]
MLFPVILSGGSGTRLWPLSRQLYPKQFLPLIGDKTMFQQTIERLHRKDYQDPIVVCNEEHRFLVAEQLRQIGIENATILLEPVGRNTAPAIAMAAYEAIRRNEEAVLLVLPSDHVMEDASTFCDTIKRAMPIVEKGKLVTFGIVPETPKTCYGYIHRGREIDKGVFEVDAFIEKPDARKAEEYQESGDFYWNSGMFVFHAKKYLEELQTYAPEMAECCKQAFAKVESDLDFRRIDCDSFTKCPSDSIDFAVMEKTKHAAVIPLDVGWNDVGSWNALLDVCEKDEEGNSIT